MKLMELKIRRVGVKTGVDEVVEAAKIHPKLLVLLVGLPGVGKSHYRKLLDAAMKKEGIDPLPVASTDDVIEQEAALLGKSYAEIFSDKAYVEKVNKDFTEMVKKSAEDGTSLLVDRTNTNISKRQFHLDVTKNNGFFRIAVVFDVAPEVHKKRLENRAEKDKKVIPDDVIERMRSEYEPPTHEEGFDEIIFISG